MYGPEAGEQASTQYIHCSKKRRRLAFLSRKACTEGYDVPGAESVSVEATGTVEGRSADHKLRLWLRS